MKTQISGRRMTVTFDDFTGEFGDLGATNAPNDTFTGTNVMRYSSGLVGPRPGLIELTPTGLANGAVWGFRGLGSQTNGVVYGQSTNVIGFTHSGPGAATTLGTVASAPAIAQIIQHGDKGYVVILADKGYEIDPAGVAVTAYANSKAGEVLCVYDVRMCIAGVAANPNRVYFSDADDFTTWGASSYFDFGPVNDDWGAVFLDEVRNRLAIANQAEWHVVSGTLGVDDVLKRTPREIAPKKWYNVARLGERVWFIPYDEDFPAAFSGVVTDKLRWSHLEFTADSGNEIAAAAANGSDTLVFVEATASNAAMLMFYGGIPTYHTLGVPTSRLVSPLSEGGIGIKANPILFCDGGGAAANPRFFVFAPYLERPGKTGDTDAQPGDASTTPLTANLYTPEVFAPGLGELTVRTVRVDFAKWNPGNTSVTNHFDMVVRSLHRFQQDSTKDSATVAFDETAALTTADETPDSRQWGVGDQGTGHGFQIRLDAIRGVGIDRIVVEADIDPPRT